MALLETAEYSFTGTFSSPKVIVPVQIARGMSAVFRRYRAASARNIGGGRDLARCAHGRKRGIPDLTDRERRREDRAMTAPRSAASPIVFVGFDDVQALDVTGPWEVFNTAGLIAGRVPELRLLTPGGREVRTNSGLRMAADGDARPHDGKVGTLVVPGGLGVRDAIRDPALVAAVGELAGRARRVAGVCTGAFLLAEAGLLDGRRATTHWASCDRLAERYPEVAVEPDPIFVRDGDVVTSAGVTAGMDLALALAEEDHGPGPALQAARMLVVYARRPGGQAQFSVQLSHQMAEREPIRELQGWIADHLEDGPLGRRRSPVASTSPSASSRASSGARSGRARPTTSSASGSSVLAASSRPTGRRSTPSPPAADSPEPRSCAAPSSAGSAPARASTATASGRRWRPDADPTTADDPEQEQTMQIAIPIFPAFTALDAIGPYEVLQRLPEAEVVFCAEERGPVRTEQGMLAIVADRAARRGRRARRDRRPRRQRHPAHARTRRTRTCAGSPPCTRARAGRPPSARARRCSPPPACSTGSTRRRTGRRSACSISSAPSPSPSASSCAAR